MKPTPSNSETASPQPVAGDAGNPSPFSANSAAPIATTGGRLAALAVLVPCSIVLFTAVRLSPDPRGYGTHQQLGSGPCGLLLQTGYPCPTCGMTTAFAHTVRGHWLRAAYVQPAGFVLALLTAVAVGVSAWVLLTSRVPFRLFAILTPYRLFFGTLILLLGGWAMRLAIGLLDGSYPVRGVLL